MNWMFAVEGFTAILGVAIITLLAARLLAYRATSAGPGDAEDFSTFSMARFGPMSRLISGDDEDFLASQPGYRRRIGRTLRRNRRRIFRMYLRELAAEFHRLHAAARAVVAESTEESAHMVGLLLRQQILFWRSMVVLEVSLLVPGLYRADLRKLVEAMEGMRASLVRIVPETAV